MDELLADRAVQGLSPAEDIELEGLLARSEAPLDHGLERAAAAADLAMSAGRLPAEMPAEVRARLLEMGRVWASKARAGELAEESAPAEAAMASPLRLAGPLRLAPAEAEGMERVTRVERVGPVGRGERARPMVLARVGAWGGWLAAAASLAVAALYSTRTPGLPLEPAMTPALPLVTRWDNLRAKGASGRSDDVVAVASQPGQGPVEGELLYDTRSHEGYVAVAGLDVSERQGEKYQLWIIDHSRSEPYPVAAGTFEITPTLAGAKVVIPARTQLPVKSPVGFAITREPQGGSVLPSPDRVVFHAEIPQAGPPAPGPDGPDFGDEPAAP